jgi:hypothetical protein
LALVSLIDCGMRTTLSRRMGLLLPGLVFAIAGAAPTRSHAQRTADLYRGSITARAQADVRLSLQSPRIQQPRKRSTGGRIALQFAAASVGAAGGGLGGFLMLRDVGEHRVEGDAGYTRAGNVGYLVGSWIGATIGAHAVGTSMGAKAPVWATALGALVGTAPLIALGVDEPYLPLFGLALGWIPQGAMAAGGFAMAER